MYIRNCIWPQKKVKKAIYARKRTLENIFSELWEWGSEFSNPLIRSPLCRVHYSVVVKCWSLQVSSETLVSGFLPDSFFPSWLPAFLFEESHNLKNWCNCDMNSFRLVSFFLFFSSFLFSFFSMLVSRVREYFMLSNFLSTSSFCTVKCAKKQPGSCLRPLSNADSQPAALCETVVFKYRIQHLLKETASTYLWIAFSLLQTNIDISFLAFVSGVQSWLLWWAEA